MELPDIKAPISASMIICGLRCERKFLYRYRWGVVPKIVPFAPSPRFGSLFHRLLQLGPEGIEGVRKDVIDEQKKLMERIEHGEDLTGELVRTARGLTELLHKAIAVAKIFWEKCPQPDYLETIAKEQKIELPEFEGHKWKGYVDSIVRNKETGDIWIRDAKTTSRKLSAVTIGYAWGIQCRLYRLLVSKWLGEEAGNLKGMLLDIVRTPTIKYCPDTKDKGGFDSYIKRIKEWYAEQDEEAMVSKGVVFTEEMMPSDLCRVLCYTYELLDWAAEPGRFDKDPTGQVCREYERTCPYYDLCSSDERLWSELIKTQFEILEREEDTDNGNQEDSSVD